MAWKTDLQSHVSDLDLPEVRMAEGRAMIEYNIHWSDEDRAWIATLEIKDQMLVVRTLQSHGKTPEDALSIVKDGAVVALAHAEDDISRLRMDIEETKPKRGKKR